MRLNCSSFGSGAIQKQNSSGFKKSPCRSRFNHEQEKGPGHRLLALDLVDLEEYSDKMMR